MRTEIAIISALTLVLSMPLAFGEIVETKGQNYDLVENFFTGEAVWTSHPERIMDGGWQNYALSNTGDKVIFNTNAVGSFVFDKNSCSYSIYGNGFDGEQIIPSVSAVATYLNNGQWQNLPVNDEACTVTVDRYEDGVFLTSTKVITEDITEDVFIDYTGTTENFYANSTNTNFELIQSSNGTNIGYYNGETITITGIEKSKFSQEIRLDIIHGFKETFKIWHDGSEELGISQTVHTGESITIGGQTINIAELNGQSFDRQFIVDNEAEILELTDSINYDFDTGIDSLSNVNIIFDGDYKVNMDFSEGNFVGYLEIDPTFTATGSVNGGNWDFDLSSLNSVDNGITGGTLEGGTLTTSQINDISSNLGSTWSTPTISEDYKIHKFTSTGSSTFTVTAGGGSVSSLIVGGGGAGAHGGGGGGGVLQSSSTVTTGSYPVTVGVGHTGGQYYPSTWTTGGDSSFNGMTAGGGGSGGYAGTGTQVQVAGSNGDGTGGTVTGGHGEQGTNGGGSSGGYGTGGQNGNYAGGGASGNGGVAGTGQGGLGIYSDITGTAVSYGDGGGGGKFASKQIGGNGNGGIGGGDQCPTISTPTYTYPVTSGTANTGGGGGGSWICSGMSGGSGIVVVRYVDDGSITASGGTVSTLTNFQSAYPTLSLNWEVPTIPQPPTGLTTVTGVPVELDWTAPTDTGNTPITGYKVFRTLNEYAYSELPDNSANSAGIDFTNNEFLTHGLESTTSTSMVDVVWDTNNLSGGTASGSTFTGSVNGWSDGIARSVQSISPETGGGEMTCTKSDTYAMCGFSNDPFWTSGDTWKNGDYLLYRDEIYENGSGLGGGAFSSSTGSVFKITMDENGQVDYYVDGTYIDTSSVTASGDYYVLAVPYNSGNFVTAQISQEVTTTSIPDKSTNNISVTSAVSNLDEMNDSSLWTQVGTDVGITNGKLIADFNAGSDHRAIKDVGVLSDQFVSHFDFKAVSAPTAPYWTMFAFTDDTTVPRGTNDGVYALIDMGSWNIYLRSSDGNTDTTSQTGSISLSAGNQYYVTYTRDSATSHSMSVYTDEARTSQVGSTITATIGGTVDNLQYFQTGRIDGGNAGSPVQYEIDNLSISDGTTIYALEYAGTSTTGIIGTGIQNPNLSFTDSNLPDGTDDFSIGSWVKLDMGSATSTQSTGGSDTGVVYFVNSGWQRQFVGQEFNTGHELIGKNINSVTLSLKQASSPNDVYKLVKIDSSGTVTNLQDVDISSITTSYQDYTFNSFTPFTLAIDDKIGIYSDGVSGSSSSIYIDVEKDSSDSNTNSKIYQIHDTLGSYAISGDLKFTISYQTEPTNTKLLGLNDVTFNVGTTSASVDGISTSTRSTGNAWSFDGSNDYVNLAGSSNAHWKKFHDGSDWTISWLMKIDQTDPTGYTSIMGTGEGGTAKGFDISFDDDSQDHGLRVRMEDGTGKGNTIKIDGAIPKDTTNWYHYVVTHDGSETINYEIFRDGVSLGTAEGKDSGFSYSQSNPTHNMRLGVHSSHSMWKYFHGDLDDVIMYDSVLSTSQISELYSSGSVNGVTPYAHYNFEQTSGTLTDQSGNGYDGSNSGATHSATGASITSSTPFTVISATGLTDNTSTPQHYTFTRSNNDWTIYQNGVSEATATDTTSLGANSIASTLTQEFTSNLGGTTANGVSTSQAKGSQLQSGHTLIGTTIGQIDLNLGCGGTCSGTASVGVWTSASQTPNVLFGTIDFATVPSSLTTYSFNDNTHTLAVGDVIGISCVGCSNSNRVQMSLNNDNDPNEVFAETNPSNGHTSWLTNSAHDVDYTAYSGSPASTSYYTAHIDGMIDEYFINSDSLTSTEVEMAYDKGTEPTQIATTGSTTPSYDDSNVTGGNEYFYTVKATNAVGDSDFLTPLVSGLAGTPPNIPTSVSSAINNPNTAPLDITVSWSAPTNVGSGTLTGFEIYRDSVLITTTGLVSSYTDTVPSGGGTFEYKLKAVSTHGISGFSATTTTTTPTVPPAPTNAPALAINNPNPSPLDIEVSWTEPASGGSIIQSYEIFRSADDVTYTSVGTVTDLDFTDTVPSAGTWYYKFTAINLVGSSGLSPSNSIATPTVPSSPLNASSVIPSINSAPYDVTVSWDLPTSTGGSALTGYNVYRQTGTGAFSLITTTTALGYVDTVPTALNQDYTYKIHAVNNVGESTGFVTTTITTFDVPDAPVLSFTTGTTALSWTVPNSDASITGYKIFRDSSLLTTVTTTSHSDFTPINFGQSYQYEVKAVSSLGDSASSNSIVTTPETEISGMVVQGITGTGAVIDWEEPAYYQGQITSYSVYYATPATSANPTISAGTTTNTYSNFAPTLDYDTSYTFGVIVNSPLGTSGFSNLVNATTNVDSSIVAYDPNTGGMAWFDIDSVSEQTVNVIEFQRETQNLNINGTFTDVDTLQVGYPSWWDSMTCNIDYKFAQKTEQYVEGTDMTAVINSADANQQVIGFQFQDIDNEVIEVECAPQQSTQDDGVSAKYIMTQTDLSTGTPNIPLVTQIQAFQTGDYGTDGEFGALDVVGLFVILISMVGFNRLSPIVGVLLSASLVFALSFFGIISLPTVLVGIIALVIFLAWGITRNR